MKQFKPTKFWVGSMEVTVHNIDEAKEISEHLSEIILGTESGFELNKHLNDFCYAVNVAYQAWYGLGSDDWETVDKSLTTGDTIKLTNTQFLCDDCKTVHNMTPYAIAQTSMNVAVDFTCECGHVSEL